MAPSPDLVSWLREQIAEDRRLAEAVKLPGPCIVEDDGYPAEEYPEDVAHIANWSVARVLAECDAKERLLAAHEAGEPWPGGEPRCRVCVADERDERDISENDPDCYHYRVAAPCPVVRVLALPYSDRPGYREEWRPA